MSDSYNDIEAHIQVASASTDENPNIAKLAVDFVVPESRLYAL